MQWHTIELSHPELYIEPAEYTRSPMADTHTSGSLLGICRDVRGNENAHIWVGWSYGVIELGIHIADHDPGLIEIDDWETVDEGVIDLGNTAMLTRTTLSHIRPPELDQLHELPAGRHGIRVSARGRDRDRADVTILIQLWPTTQRSPVTQVKHEDAFDLADYRKNLSRIVHHLDPRAPAAPQTSPAATFVVRAPTSATPATSLSDQWHRLHQTIDLQGGNPHVWPMLVRPAAHGDAIGQAEGATAGPWPRELHEWFTLHNGGGDIDLLPAMTLLSLDQLVRMHQIQRDIWADLAAEDPDLDHEQIIADNTPSPAGSEAGQFLLQYIPIAERDGTLLVCDIRPGRQHGCITEFGKDTADAYPPEWISVSAMITDLTDSIANHTPFRGSYLPTVTRDGLSWEIIAGTPE